MFFFIIQKQNVHLELIIRRKYEKEINGLFILCIFKAEISFCLYS